MNSSDGTDQRGEPQDPDELRALEVVRVIQAPRDLVFEAFTEARHLDRWWGPSGFATVTRALEFREGGVWEFVMTGPDGTDYPNRIEWREITPPERIALWHGERAGDPDGFSTTITIRDRGQHSEVVLRSVFNTKAQRDQAIERHNAIEGGKQTLGRLAAHVTPPADHKDAP